jgi:ribosomal protein S3
MGQKTNPIVFRLGKTKEWELKHFEKKSNESSYYIFKELEIQKFTNKFFNDYGLKIKKCKVFMNERMLHIYSAYYTTEKSHYLIAELNNKKKLKLSLKNKINQNFKKRDGNKTKFYRFWAQTRKFKNLGSSKQYSDALYLNTAFKNSYRVTRNKNLAFYKKPKLLFPTSESFVSNNKFAYRFIKSLNEYLNINDHYTIVLTCKHINKNLITQLNKKDSKIIKRVMPQLRRYQNNSYFNDGINLLFQSVINKQSQKLIAEYIAVELGKLKRHSFFFRFIQTAFTLFYKQKFSKIYGIKIQIKGRLNGNPRSKKKIINIGKSIKNLSLLYNINFSESTAHTKNGSFGVKIWLSEKT